MWGKTLLVLVHYAAGRQHLLLKKFHTSDFLVVFHATQLLPCLNDVADSIVGDCLHHGEDGLDEMRIVRLRQGAVKIVSWDRPTGIVASSGDGCFFALLR